MTNPTATINSASHAYNFLTAGHALFTLVSKKTGARRTFLVKKPPESATATSTALWVYLLTGPENTSDYKYLGYFRPNDAPSHFRLNKTGWGEDSGRVFSWLLDLLVNHNHPDAQRRFESDCEFWHAGQCGKCGRTLTDPESITRGLGPKCANRE